MGEIYFPHFNRKIWMRVRLDYNKKILRLMLLLKLEL